MTSDTATRRGRTKPLRVLLLSMPLAALERPSLGLSLLKARLDADGIATDVRYPSFTFADFVGLEEYLWLHGDLPYTAFAGDWTFTESLYGTSPERDAGYLDEILRKTWRLNEASIARIARARAYCEPFLEHCLASIPWQMYNVVGFTSTFEQNIASLALAQRVKAVYPETLIAFGGANWEGEMGEELHARFPFVDLVCSGESDESFPEVVATIARGKRPGTTRGIVYRDAGRTVSTGPAPLVRDLDRLPFPDYDDFFDSLLASPTAAAVTPMLLLETSRGCWWGAKHHCTFCGLNGGSMTYRSKHAERVLDEIHHFRDRYGAGMLSVVDNILDMSYFRTLLPLLAEERMDLNLFYEVKANLSLDQVRLLADAGVRRIQPGIESFSDHVLSLMRKGTTRLQNVQLLKWCREFGITPEWNLLYGFPGEFPSDYEEMLPLIDMIDFLDPPGAYGPVRLDRFSPYHSDPSSFGIVQVEPLSTYRYLYPFDRDSLLRIAYYFDYEFSDRRTPLEYVQPVVDRIQRWMDEGPAGGLWLIRGDGDRIVLVRDRPGTSRMTVELAGWQSDVYLGCDAARSVAGLRRLNDDLHAIDEGTLREFLDWSVAAGLMIASGDRYLALAVHSPARTEAETARERAVAAVG